MEDINKLTLDATNPQICDSIIFFGKYPNDEGEMMRISKDGFYWKGEKVEDKYNIYERFNDWLKGHGK